MADSLQSPRPLPLLLPDTPFSQRKRTPFRAPHPPRAPAKSCPPVSRVFSTPDHVRGGPHEISFTAPKPQGLQSPSYDPTTEKPYFEQCYQVLELLGAGSFGEVFKVRCRDDGCLYAVKRSRQPFRGEWDRRERLVEVERHEKLPPHRNLLRFHRAWEERRHLYIQTELCLISLSEYGDLYGRMPEYRVWSVLHDLVKGLQHLHDNGLCHFDIKPANVFLAHDGVTWKLGDFGLCVSLEQGLSSAVEGDAKYVAPELLRGAFDKPADVFSLGISLLEMACELELPSGGGNWHLLRQGSLPLHFTQGLSPALVGVLSAMMHTEPSQRPTVRDLLHSSPMQTARYKYCLHRACLRAVCLARGLCSWLYLLLLAVLSLPRRLASSVSPPSGAPSPLLDAGSTSEEQPSTAYRDPLNRSWIKNSPVRYPSPAYTGPPIPINFDSSEDGTPDRSPRTSSRNSSPVVGTRRRLAASSARHSSPGLRRRLSGSLELASHAPRNLLSALDSPES